MVENTRPRPSAIAFIGNAVLLLCLLAPSAWMITTVPPLWRDVDAYIQLTQDPRLTTFWGHGPAYGYVAKIPLFLGEQWERWRGMAVVTPESGVSPLTDTGVWLLIIAQHLALAGSAVYFIRAISRPFWIRLALAVAWASNALFYTFAHCLGSETLSLILVVLFVGKGLKLVQSRDHARWTDWYVFAIGLCLCLLSRQVNALLILLLPAAFLLSSIQNLISSYSAANEEQRRRLRQLWTRSFQQALIAIAVGISCVLIAGSLTQSLARKTRFHPHSRMGYTFLFRLQFLKALPPPARTVLLTKILARTSSNEACRLITLLDQLHDQGANSSPQAFNERAAALLYPSETLIPWEKLDERLNEMAFAFLLLPPAELRQAARTDVAAALKTSVAEIIDNLFETTGYFFEHRDQMPGCASLLTFRNSSADTISRIPAENFYFYLWRGATPNKLLLLCFFSLVLLLVIARWKRVDVTAISSFGIALVAVGLLITVANSLLTEFLPRFVLSIWQLLFLSFSIFAGLTADLLTARGSVSNRDHLMENSPPGSHCRPEP
ncbi:MAG: hypothetical protein QOI49_1158 [Verrucomicrobiota bacterium]|jgi:hypothetical protein